MYTYVFTVVGSILLSFCNVAYIGSIINFHMHGGAKEYNNL